MKSGPKRGTPNPKNKKHGFSHLPVYRVWRGVWSRCTDSNTESFKYYGGRGISVTPRWRKFENFIEDMGFPPPGMQLDRIKNNGNYSKGNCRWVSRTKNANNKSSNLVIEVYGEKGTVAHFTRKYKLGEFTIYRRIDAGWTGNSLVQPARKRKTK